MTYGNYGISALMFSIEHCLAGSKAKSSYIKEPVMSNATEEDDEEKELSKMLLVEEQWIAASKQNNLPETIIL